MNGETRVRLGARTTTEPDVLVDLAKDSSVTVRAALALNSAAPHQANEILAGDPDERVRVLLARKLTALVPTLSTVEQEALCQQTWEMLADLVADEAVRVRAVIADAVKEMPHAPRELIQRLAHDLDVSVSEPVIRFSPLLTNQDLLSLIARAPDNATVLAVAHRPRLEPVVADAIAATSNSAAIRALLANSSAQIREATLDALVARSVDHPDWHEPLVRRPCLTARSARLLSDIVAAHLLEVLAARTDFATQLAEDLRARVATRLADEDSERRSREPTADEALVWAQQLAKQGELVEDVLLAAARRGEARYVAALLAVAADTTISVVDRAASLRSAKGMVSLVWKAGFTMRAAVTLQTLLARLTPDAVLSPGPGGSFPLAVEEMRWQFDFLSRMGR